MPRTDKKPWTVMVYMVAESSDEFERDARADLDEMRAGLAALTDEEADRLHVVALLDRPQPHPPVFCVVKKAGIEANVCPAVLGHSLGAFGEHCIRNYPAKNNLLVLWGHGEGIDWKQRAFGRGNGKGFGTGPSKLSIKMIRDALTSLEEVLNGRKLVVGFDACLMGMAEIHHEIQKCLNWVIAPADEIPLQGWPYTEIVAELGRNKGGQFDGPKGQSQLASSIVNKCVESYERSRVNLKVGFSGSDLSKCANLLTAMNGLVKKLKGNLGLANVLRDVKAARREAQDFKEKAYVDLAFFCFQLYQRLKWNEAKSVLAVLEKLAPKKTHRRFSRDYPPPYIEEACSVNICFPEETTWERVKDPKDPSKYEDKINLALTAPDQNLRIHWKAYQELGFNAGFDPDKPLGGDTWMSFLMAFWTACGAPDLSED